MRFIVALAFVVCLSLPSFAQESTVVIDAPLQQRQGVLVTPSWTVPLDAVGVLTITANIPTSDYENPANSLIMRIYLLINGVWTRWRGNDPDGWRGGPAFDFDGNPNPAPYFDFSLDGIRGRQVRGEAEIPVRMRVGFTLSTTP